ncbi:Cytochrome oxidase Cu insertion factor, SCO1/SenC/PrrC family [Geopseudomonas sagittaria]|uniref:Cytochrome oxidase Cu insertion factor, SCO1/SenC/PrrC family n=1 Tax=Geopseudomonas sagittaria TaxID=1135990 RepID=A0A1I5Q4E6_9GAMM|nr:SCO family protein [Pseudomonas sagittaria]SFP40890.1 Cytochrome oxidase Cu insertion factor, SCO1/SenC/PrrC family [Pseudomonas sagittaria]
MNLHDWLAVALVACLGVAIAEAHEEHAAAPAAKGPVAQAVAGGGTLDARSYFTDTELLNQDGETVRFYSDVLAGRVVLLNVIFTSCEDACPLITRKLAEVRKALGNDAAQVHFISLSSDPVKDSPQALKAYARKHGADDANWTFLTGPKAQMDVVLGRLGQLSRSPEEHSTLLIAGDVANKRWSKIRPDAPPAAIAQRLQLLTLPPAVGR